MNLGQLGVAKRRLGSAERHIGVADDSQVEGMCVVGVRRAKRGDQELGLERVACAEELEGEVLLRL